MFFNCLLFFIFGQISNYYSADIIIMKNRCKNTKISLNVSFKFFTFNDILFDSLCN